jgi:hypothetical protein
VVKENPVQDNFCYEAMWPRAPENFLEEWSEGVTGQRSLRETWSNLNRVARSLKDWSKEAFGLVWNKIRKLEGRLQYIRGQSVLDLVLEEARVVERELCELFGREEIMAHQRSCVECPCEGG